MAATAPAGDADVDGALLGALLHASPDGLAIVSDGRLLAANDRLFEMWGLSDEERSEVRGLGPTVEALSALVAAIGQRTVDDVPAGERATLPLVHDIALRDGRVIERRSSASRTGEAQVRVLDFRDVTHRRAADAELRRRAAEQEALASLTDQALAGASLEGLLAEACTLAVQLLGYQAVAITDVAGDVWRIRASAGPAAPPVGLIPAPVERGVTGAFGFVDAHEIALPGSERTLRVLGAYARQPHVFGHDEVRLLESLAGVLNAALARFRAEEALAEREAQLRAVFEAPLDAMLVVGDDGRVVDVNAAACELLGRRREVLVERPLADAVPALGPGGSDRWELRRAVGRASGEIEVPTAGDGRRVAEYTAVAGIRPGRDLVVLRDVTERKQMGARLALADRMASVGTLAAGVAHELNNPLAYVSANLSFLSERVVRTGELLEGHQRGPDDADLAAQLGEAVRDARDGCDRMRVIIRDLKTFSRTDDEHTGPVDLGRVIDSAVNMAWNEIKHRAKLVKDVAGLPPVHGNESRLGQVFLNLLVNAAQSLPEGHAEGNHIRVSGTVLPDGRVAVEVKDTGCGIPAGHLARIFDPFFTTKPPGVGTGLGLSICHSIVGAFGGEIQVQSEHGKGSTFRVVLRPAGARSARHGGEPAAPVARARILVVDDEAMVGTVLARTLRSEHDVQVVTSARAALDRLAAGERFDLILSDLLMPEMTGMDLYDAIEARDAGLVQRMVFLTGGAFTPAAREFLIRKQVVCIEKPFEVSVLRAALARKLAERPALAT